MERLVPHEITVPTLLKTERFRLRPLTIPDVVKDFDAVMTSKEHLLASLPWDWLPDDMTLEQNLIDLGWHQKEFQIRTSFAFTVVSLDEARVLGCVYIDPSTKVGYEAEVTMWVRADEFVTGLDQALESTVRRWLTDAWPFTRVSYPGRDMPWSAWDALPNVG